MPSQFKKGEGSWVGMMRGCSGGIVNELPVNQILCGDATGLMRGLPDASIHAIVTDPPYGLEFMGEEWDKFAKGRISEYKKPNQFSKGIPEKGFKPLPKFNWSRNKKCLNCGKWAWDYPERKCACEHPQFAIDTSFQLTYQSWTTAWAREALRVLVPGASMLVMGGTRTYHRMACGVEDAGFEVKDTILWCYNSGFPKAQDLGKMIDKKYPRLHLFDSFARHFKEQRQKKNLSQKEISKHFPSKTGGLTGCVWNWENGMNVPTREQWNVLKPLLDLSDEYSSLIERVETAREKIGETDRTQPKYLMPNQYDGQRAILDITAPATDFAREWDGWKVGGLKPSYEPVVWAVKPPEGPYVENVLKHGVGAINIDACRIPYESEDDRESTRFGVQTDIKGGGYGSKRPSNGNILAYDVVSSPQGRYPANMVRTDRFEDGYDRFYFVPKAERAERWFKCQICNVYQDGTHLRNHGAHALHCHDCGIDFPNTDEEKEAHKNHRTESNIVAHPTVKPVALGEFLIKLVTREGQIVLDPFTGLGSFLVSARNLNRHYIGFDNGSEFVEIARRRLAAIPPPLEVFA